MPLLSSFELCKLLYCGSRLAREDDTPAIGPSDAIFLYVLLRLSPTTRLLLVELCISTVRFNGVTLLVLSEIEFSSVTLL